MIGMGEANATSDCRVTVDLACRVLWMFRSKPCAMEWLLWVGQGSDIFQMLFLNFSYTVVGTWDFRVLSQALLNFRVAGWAIRWVQNGLVSFKVVAYCVCGSAETQGFCSAGAPWEPGWEAGLLMGFRGDNRAEPGNSRSGRKAGLQARENPLG